VGVPEGGRVPLALAPAGDPAPLALAPAPGDCEGLSASDSVEEGVTVSVAVAVGEGEGVAVGVAGAEGEPLAPLSKRLT
jgi:hypothetical protein